jgi:membrane protease YdiL (CAAX protease family)
MHFKKTICENCQIDYDECLEICPECKKENKLFDEYKLSHEMTWTTSVRQLLLFLFGWLGLQIFSIIYSIGGSIIFAGQGYDENYILAILTNTKNALTANSVIYAILFIGVILIIWPNIKSILKSFTKSKNILYGFILGFALLGAGTVYGLIIASFYSSASSGNANQIALELMIQDNPALSIIIFGLVGPLVEEFTYRVGLFNLLSRSKRWIAYIATIAIFAFIHFDFQSILNMAITYNRQTLDAFINEIVNLPQYMIAGAILCYSYEKYGFAGSSIAHIINNLTSILSVIVIANM